MSLGRGRDCSERHYLQSERAGGYVSPEAHRVFGLERIERERRDLVDFEGLTWGGPLSLIGLS